MSVSMLVVTNANLVPGAVDADGAHDNVGVVGLVVLANPCSHHSPECLESWVSSDS